MGVRKVPTILIDIDGTILEHRNNSFEIYNYPEQQPTPQAVEKFNEWTEKGYHVIVMSARPEDFQMRKHTEAQLKKWGFKYQQLVLGCGSGIRYLINDEKPSIKETAVAIVIERNKGLGEINI